MLKSTAKSALQSIARALPWGAKQALLDGMLGSLDQFERFQQIGRVLGVESISVRGANGLVWGSINDKWLLGDYAIRRKWAFNIVELFQQFFSSRHDGGTYLDIGANIGLTLFPIARNPLVQCYGFEAEPKNFAYLNLGLRANCLQDNVLLSQLAIFDSKAEVKFELSPNNLGDHRIRISDSDGLLGEGSRETIVVQADRLDNLFDVDCLKRPLAVKIDTQGSEPRIFAGGERTLAPAELVSFEFAPHSMRRIGGNVEAEFRFLAAHFREGSVAVGDEECTFQWRPISAVVDELRNCWTDPGVGTKYLDVTVRK